jgi:hypothetical protein
MHREIGRRGDSVALLIPNLSDILTLTLIWKGIPASRLRILASDTKTHQLLESRLSDPGTRNQKSKSHLESRCPLYQANTPRRRRSVNPPEQQWSSTDNPILLRVILSQRGRGPGHPLHLGLLRLMTTKVTMSVGNRQAQIIRKRGW